MILGVDVFIVTRFSQSTVTAVLGPTNTGKTHLAVERMCGHSSGIIGFPLRLLAREVYDRVVKIKGADQVALLTGEEKIVPPKARWFLATVESMPLEAMTGGLGRETEDGPRDFSFVAIDEAQLGAHPERGHVFTDRMLHARGRDETMILGSQSLAPLVRALIPEAEIITRPRFSTLRYAGAKKLSRLPPRSAIIAFSAEEVYAVAEMLRRFRGGAAVVMGALSPATRNAQVAMYQAGEVDYLVATDAIGMGLNMDVDHVAFAALGKYDGQKRRRLHLAEMAQIAGRAGRHQRDGSFGTLAGGMTGKASTAIKGAEFNEDEIIRIEEHEFPPLRSLFWRNATPRFDDLDTLIFDLEERPDDPVLKAAPEAIDLAVLKRLSVQRDIAGSVRGVSQVQRFWSACSLPDFQQRGVEHHSNFVAQLWHDLRQGNGAIPRDFVARKIADLDNIQGDVEKLGGRIAAIRTWAYVAQRRDWLDDPQEMAGRAQAVEERLSDALHKALAQRFVDRRTSVLMRKLGNDATLLPVRMKDDDAIEVDGEPIGWLRGFRFEVAADARLADRKLLLAAADRHLSGLLAKRAGELLADGPEHFEIVGPGAGVVLHWRGEAVARLERGGSLLTPRLTLNAEVAGLPDAIRDSVQAALEQRIKTLIRRELMPLLKIVNRAGEGDCPGNMRALLIQLADAGGVLPRRAVEAHLRLVDAPERRGFRKIGVKLGSLDVFCPDMIKPRAQTLFSMLRSVYKQQALAKRDAMPDVFEPVYFTARMKSGASHLYRAFGAQSVRIDMAEKLVLQAHDMRKKTGVFAVSDRLAVSMGLKPASYEKLLYAAGFRKAGTQQAASDPVQMWRWRGLSKPRKRIAKTDVPSAPHLRSPFAALADLKAARD